LIFLYKEKMSDEDVYKYCHALNYVDNDYPESSMSSYCSEKVTKLYDPKYSNRTKFPAPDFLPWGRLNLEDPYVCGCYYPQWVYDSYVDELASRGSNFDSEIIKKKLKTVEGRQCLFEACANSICQPSRKPSVPSPSVPSSSVPSSSEPEQPQPSNNAGPCPTKNIGECFQTVQMEGNNITWENSPTSVSRQCNLSFGNIDSESFINGGVVIEGQGTDVFQGIAPWEKSVKGPTITLCIGIGVIVILSILVLWWGFHSNF